MKQSVKEHELYEKLVRAHGTELYRFAFRLCGQAENAEDLLQETYCEAWRSIHTLRDAEKGRSLLYTIVRHRYAHYLCDRARRVRPALSLDQLGHAESAPGEDILAVLSSCSPSPPGRRRRGAVVRRRRSPSASSASRVLP